MIAVILLAVATLLVGLDLEWLGAGWFGDWPVSAKLAGVAVLTLANLAVASLMMRPCTVRPGDDADRRLRRIVRYAYLRPLVPITPLAMLQVQVWVLGWPLLTQRIADAERIPPSAFVVLGLLPMVIGVVLSWVPMFVAERSMRAAPASLGGYLLYRLRTQVAFVMLPLLAIVGLSDLMDTIGRRFPESQRTIVAAGGIGILVLAVLMFPLAVRWIWPTRPLPDGPSRAMLEELCRNVGVRVRQILLWRTPGGAIANAAVLGFVAPLRFLLVTDGLLSIMTLSEQRAVFAHELGHIRKHHIPYMALLVIIFLAGMDLLARVAPLPSWLVGGHGAQGAEARWGLMAAGALAALYWGVVFGFVSRRFERQADLHCIEMGVDPNELIGAFEKISALSGMPSKIRSWRHFSMDRRIAFLRAAQADPQVATTFNRRIKWLKAMIGFAAAIAVFAMSNA